MIVVSVCLPSDALLQHLLSYLGFSYLGRGLSLHDFSSKVQLLLLTLEEGYLLTAALPDLQRGIAPLGPSHHFSGGSSQLQPLASGTGWLLKVTAPGLRRGLLLPATAPGLGRRGVGWLLPAAAPTLDAGWLLVTAVPGLGHGVAPLSHRP